jgi:hypothetical protein
MAAKHKAPMGGEGTGPNPTHRAKPGWKWSVLMTWRILWVPETRFGV